MSATNWLVGFEVLIWLIGYSIGYMFRHIKVFIEKTK